MFKFCAIAVAQSKRKWVVICATKKMAPLYKRMGFHEVGLNYEHQGLNGLHHEILVGNVPDAMMGKTVGPLEWNYIWADVANYLQQYDLLELDPATNLRLGVYRLLSPIATVARFFYERNKTKNILSSRRTEKTAPESEKAG